MKDLTPPVSFHFPLLLAQQKMMECFNILHLHTTESICNHWLWMNVKMKSKLLSKHWESGQLCPWFPVSTAIKTWEQLDKGQPIDATYNRNISLLASFFSTTAIGRFETFKVWIRDEKLVWLLHARAALLGPSMVVNPSWHGKYYKTYMSSNNLLDILIGSCSCMMYNPLGLQPSWITNVDRTTNQHMAKVPMWSETACGGGLHLKLCRKWKGAHQVVRLHGPCKGVSTLKMFISNWGAAKEITIRTSAHVLEALTKKSSRIARHTW